MTFKRNVLTSQFSAEMTKQPNVLGLKLLRSNFWENNCLSCYYSFFYIGFTTVWWSRVISCLHCCTKTESWHELMLHLCVMLCKSVFKMWTKQCMHNLEWTLSKQLCLYSLTQLYLIWMTEDHMTNCRIWPGGYKRIKKKKKSLNYIKQDY